MIAEVVVGVAEHDIEGHSAIEFPEIMPYIGAASQYKIHDVQIAITCTAACTIIKTKQRHGRSEMYATAILCPVETFGE